jgi:hypothetical protein
LAPLSYRQWSGVAALAVILGCAASKVSSRTTQANLNQLAPEASPGAKAILNYNGQLVDVDVAHKLENGQERIDLNLNGESLEHETYVRTSGAFALKEADGDVFDPPLTLLNVDSIPPWTGELTSGGVSHAATATVLVSTSSVKFKSIELPATLATVTLELDSGGPKKATRTLKFWMVRGHGVAAREFSMGVKRLPAD